MVRDFSRMAQQLEILRGIRWRCRDVGGTPRALQQRGHYRGSWVPDCMRHGRIVLKLEPKGQPKGRRALHHPQYRTLGVPKLKIRRPGDHQIWPGWTHRAEHRGLPHKSVHLLLPNVPGHAAHRCDVYISNEHPRRYYGTDGAKEGKNQKEHLVLESEHSN